MRFNLKKNFKSIVEQNVFILKYIPNWKDPFKQNTPFSSSDT